MISLSQGENALMELILTPANALQHILENFAKWILTSVPFDHKFANMGPPAKTPWEATTAYASTGGQVTIARKTLTTVLEQVYFYYYIKLLYYVKK